MRRNRMNKRRRISRRGFVGGVAAGVGAAMGMSGVAKAQTPPHSKGAVVTVYGEPFQIPIFVNTYDEKTGLIGVAVGINPDSFQSYLGDSFTEVNLPNDLGIYTISGLADVSVWKGNEVPLLVYEDVSAYGFDQKTILNYAFVTTVWHHYDIYPDIGYALQQALFDLRDGLMRLYNIHPLNPSEPFIPYLPYILVDLPDHLVAKSPPGEGAKMRVTVTAVANGFVSANANGPVDLVEWNGSAFVNQGSASALMLFAGTTTTVPNPITGGETIDVLNVKNIQVKLR
jgi:hypothetical protein